MNEADNKGNRFGRLRSKAFWILTAFVALDNVVPFVSVTSWVLLIGLFVPEYLVRTAAYLLNAYYEMKGVKLEITPKS